jgi:hypothetical protein
MNRERDAAGLPPLCYSAQLEAAAKAGAASPPTTAAPASPPGGPPAAPTTGGNATDDGAWDEPQPASESAAALQARAAAAGYPAAEAVTEHVARAEAAQPSWPSWRLWAGDPSFLEDVMRPNQVHVGVGWQGRGWSLVLGTSLGEGCSATGQLGRRLLA